MPESRPPYPAAFRHRFAPSGGGRLPCRRLIPPERRPRRPGHRNGGGRKRRGRRGHREDDAGTGKTTRAPGKDAAPRTPERRRPEAPRATRSPGRRRGHPGGMRHAPRRPDRRNGGGRKRREPRGHLIGKESNMTTGLVLVATLLLWVSMRLMSTAAVSRVLPKSISKSSFDVPSKETLRTLPVL